MLKAVDNISQFKHEVIKQFEEISRACPRLSKFIYEPSAYDSVFIIGGFLRSVANRERPRDIDVIFNMSTDALVSYITRGKIDFCRNKFGGFKINFGHISVDVWTPETNWAFNSRVINLGSQEMISRVAHGTFFNYDSLVFDLKTQKVNVSYYNDCVKTNTLDIIRRDSRYSERNPGKIGNVLRAFRIRNKTDLAFSPQVCTYINNRLIECGLFDEDKSVEYLVQLALSKQSGKYSFLQSDKVVRENLKYVFEQLKLQRSAHKVQMELFEG